jgi:BirA family biotin operon repressor/biotin-[acetyl-CoA-carboxylase] ligase
MNGLKLGGILTELMPDKAGRLIPVVGVGINLAQTEFPEPLDAVATSILMQTGTAPIPEALGHQIVERLRSMPEPNSWDDLLPIWSAHDATPGKRYKLTSGEEAVALHVGAGGELLCTINGEPKTVLAADAIFGVNRV